MNEHDHKSIKPKPSQQASTMTSCGWLPIYICTNHRRVERNNIVIVCSRRSFSLEVCNAAMWMWVGGLSDAAVFVVVPPSTLVVDSIATATSYLYLPLLSS